jgi:predicted TIM-barrel fold metal-dependent hydrolase
MDFLAAHNLPTFDELAAMRIWDNHYHGWDEMDEVMPYVNRMQIERLISLDVGPSGVEPAPQSEFDSESAKLDRYRDRVLGVMRIDHYEPEASVKKIDRWIANGPCIGIKYGGSKRPYYLQDALEGRTDIPHLTTAHPNNDPIVERVAELDGIIYIHTWTRVGGEPRTAGGGMILGQSRPRDVAKLAARHPDIRMICGHAGGDWELAVRAVRPHDNIFLEFSGGYPWAGAVEFAVNELGADRIVWGGHGPSRSYSNELSKVYDANITDQQRFRILGANLRKYALPIAHRKGYDIEP